MSTTAIFVELLIIGAQALVWVVVLAAAFWKRWPFAAVDLALIQRQEALLTGGVLIACYSLGIIVDRFADLLACRIRPERFVRSLPWLADQERPPERTPAFELAFREQRAFEVLNYYRSRFRVARALILNAPLASLAIVLYLVIAPVQRLSGRALLLVGLVFILGGAVTLVALFTTGTLEIQMNARKEALVRLLDADAGNGQDAQNPAAEPGGSATG